MRLAGLIGALIQRLAGEVVSLSISELQDRSPWVESQVPSTRSVPAGSDPGDFQPLACLSRPAGSTGVKWPRVAGERPKPRGYFPRATSESVDGWPMAIIIL